MRTVNSKSEKYGFSQPALTRFAKKIGYSGYAEFKYDITRSKNIFPSQEETVTYAHETGRGTDGKILYILGGAGGVGTCLIKMALADGWEVISAADTKEKCDHLVRLGCTHVFNCTERDEKEAIMEFTNGRGVDLVYDQWVGERLYPELDLLADFGMIVIYNWLEGEPKESFYPHMLKHATKCNAVRIYSSHLYDNNPERMDRMKKEVFGLLMSGKVTMDEYFYGSYTLDDIQEAHKILDAQTAYGKIVLKIA